MAGSRGGFGDLFAAEAKLQGAPSAADESGSFWDMMGLEKKSDEEDDLESQSFLDSAKSLWPAQFGGEGGGGGGGAPAQTQEAAVMGLSYQTRFKGFVTALLMAGFFMFLAFFVGLPVIVFRPHKFALCFTMSSVMFMASFGLLKGPMAHLRSMLAPDRLPFTGAYVGSMALTLYAALVIRSYVLVVATSSLQIATMAYYFMSFIPGGTRGVKIFLAMIVRTLKSFVTQCVPMVTRCCLCLIRQVAS